jgi:Fic family protein
VLAREGVLAPELGSIEEYLATHTGRYYATLQEVQGGAWLPERDAGPWVAFCVEAHLVQAGERLARIMEAGRRGGALEALVADRRWPDRLVIALERSLVGGADRAGYAEEADVSTATASADLRRLLDAGLVERRGATKAARYFAGDDLRRTVG